MRLQITMDDERRWREIEATFGTMDDHGHEWDDDLAAWVSRGRRSLIDRNPRDFPMDGLEVEDWPVG